MIKHQAIDSTLVGLLNTNLKVKYREMRNGKKVERGKARKAEKSESGEIHKRSESLTGLRYSHEASAFQRDPI